MEITTAYYTDVGNVKKMNQDSVSVKVANSPQGRLAFAVVCDGMGGLEHGELASKQAIVAMNRWFSDAFAQMVGENAVEEQRIFEQWETEITRVNESLLEYAHTQGVQMGTTLSALLLFRNQYFVCHVGDSRIYRITDAVSQLTTDHSLVAREVELGYLTKQQAMTDPRRSVLLQCVGASEEVRPQMFADEIPECATFILSSDGFVHLLDDKELLAMFAPSAVRDKAGLRENCRNATKRVMERGERDNISVIAMAVRA